MLTEEEELLLKDIPEELWSKGPSDVGLVKSAQPVIIRSKTEYRPCYRQYPLKPDAQEGIRPVIEDLKKAGVIIPCADSPCNTPIFPVKKQHPSTGWRMVQDLQAVNNAVIQRAPCVPDPHTLLNSLKPEMAVFTVVDISNAFFSIPIDLQSRFWFAFTYEGKRYTYTRLPQGYCESPTICSQVMTASMSTFDPPGKSQILLYVDDILLASPDEETCKKDTIALLYHLHKEGHKVNKNKLQFCKRQVKYLGHELSQNGRTVTNSRKEAILKAPKPVTKKQMMSFLGLTNYCRMWVPNYAEITNPLQKLMYEESISMTTKLKWNPEAEKAFTEIKQSLTSTTALALLLQTNMTFLSPARHLSCMATLLSQPHVTLERCTTLNPATLMPLPDDGEQHDCQELAEKEARGRNDLTDNPIPGSIVLFVDGSSKKNTIGETQTGYAVVTEEHVLKANKLPTNYSAQAAELVALTEACKLMKDKTVTIYTDSQYAFATVHTFAQYWQNRGMITSTGKPVTHAQLLKELLNAVQLPKKLAVCKCAAHTRGKDDISKGNDFADQTAKAAASGEIRVLMTDE